MLQDATPEAWEHELTNRLTGLEARDRFRRPRLPGGGLDFASNDYLGLARDPELAAEVTACLQAYGTSALGSTGSRLLTGHYALLDTLEHEVAQFHATQAAQVFNSGYDANLGLISCLLGRGDTWLYDASCHASIRDGLRLSPARSHHFRHNDLDDLHRKYQRAQGRTVIVVESLYSMDGDLAPLPELAAFCRHHGTALVVDEAHATGVLGPGGRGVVQELGVEDVCLARLHTFGKALGGHGAAVVGSARLCQWLQNAARPLIYTTALPPHAAAVALCAYRKLPLLEDARHGLLSRMRQLMDGLRALDSSRVLGGAGPIAGWLVPGNLAVQAAAAHLQAAGLDVRPIRTPTVPAGTERLRFCLHAQHTAEDVHRLLTVLADVTG